MTQTTNSNMFKFNIETPTSEDIFARNNNGLSGRVSAYFTSNVVGSNIVNAVTGDVYTERVGSRGEERYFRVIDATGKFDSNGRPVGQNCINPNSNKLFYLNKSQYTQHMMNKKYVIDDTYCQDDDDEEEDDYVNIDS